MENLVIKGIISLDESTKILVYCCYGLSCCFTSATVVIFMLNLDQLGSSKIKNRTPAKRPTTILYIMFMVLQVLLQIFIITVLSGCASTNCAGLISVIIYTSFLFHSMFTALLLRAYKSVKYAFLAHAGDTIHWHYCFVGLIPTVVFVPILIECYHHRKGWACNMFNRTYVKTVILIFNGISLIFGYVIVLATILMRWITFAALNLNWNEEFQRFKDAKRLRNLLTMTIIITVLFSCNIKFLADDIHNSDVVLSAVFHLIMGAHFFFLEFWFFDKDFKTPFRWQHQKKARQDALGEKGHVNIALSER